MTAVVVGGGIAGLVAARDLARHGTSVVLLERSERLGGRVRGEAFAGTTVDVGAESFATRGGAVTGLLDELGMGGDVVDQTGSAWVALPGGTVPLPSGGVLGIPGNPLADDVRRVLGGAGAARAYADRLLPVLKGRYDTLGPLVRGRMGARVLDRLVAPVVTAVYGVDPETVPVDLIAPGLNRAITTTGTLSSAVLKLRADAPAGAAARGIAGGVHRLVLGLADELDRLGVDVRLQAEVIGAHPVPRGSGFTVVTPSADLEADQVVLAADGATALDLLKDAAYDVAMLPRPVPAVSRAVLIAVDDARLDGAPRGTGVLRAGGVESIRAHALTHASAKWVWLGEALPPHRHVLRLAYRGADDVPDDTVRADAATLLGVPIAAPRERIDTVWVDPVPPLDPATVAIRAALAATELPTGLSVVGAWTAGTGLASVVASARR